MAKRKARIKSSLGDMPKVWNPRARLCGEDGQPLRAGQPLYPPKRVFTPLPQDIFGKEPLADSQPLFAKEGDTPEDLA